jgi:predicted nucleic acid-binding protein
LLNAKDQGFIHEVAPLLRQLKVVSNTTPILSLLKIEKLDLLKELFGGILVPYAVFREIEAGKSRKFYADLTQFEWISIERIREPNARSYLLDLDDGEAETLILAKEQAADLVIIDEKPGRQYVKRFDLALTGTIGILLNAKDQGFIHEVAPLLRQLQQNQSWISEGLVETALKIAGEEEAKRTILCADGAVPGGCRSG